MTDAATSYVVRSAAPDAAFRGRFGFRFGRFLDGRHHALASRMFFPWESTLVASSMSKAWSSVGLRSPLAKRSRFCRFICVSFSANWSRVTVSLLRASHLDRGVVVFLRELAMVSSTEYSVDDGRGQPFRNGLFVLGAVRP
jgi:hypothetical protein